MRERVHARCGCGFSQERETAVSAASSASSGARPFALSTSRRHYERDRPFEVVHLGLDWVLDIDDKSLSGSAELTLERRDPEARFIELDAIAFELGKVQVDGKTVRPEYDGHVLRVPIAEKLAHAKVTVNYTVRPRRGMYFLGPDEHYPQRPRQVWTQCQEEDARHFIPCHDKPHVKMKSSVRVVVPKGYRALSNGVLAKEDKVEGNPRFAWEMREPHASYLLTLVVGEFAEIEEKAGSVPLSYLVPKSREADALPTFGRTPKMIETFAGLIGVPYPWNKYAQVVVSDFIFGGMENTTATTMYEHILLDETARLDITSDDLIAHELAHQWFGDYVTCRDWSEGWLNEGFATYFEHVWQEAQDGIDEYEYGLLTDLGSYLSEARGRYRRPVVCSDYDAPLDLFDRHLYEKGGLFLHTLRAQVGKDRFFEVVRRYLTRHAKGIVETRDLQRVFEEVTGKGFGRVFDEGLYKPGHPEIEVDISFGGGMLRVAAKQTQGAEGGVPAVFHVSIPLDIVDDDGVRREVLSFERRAETFVLPLTSRPSFVVVDPGMRILGDVTVRAPSDMLRAQLEGGKTARARWLAAQSLANQDDTVTIKALARRLGDEAEFWGVRAECAAALGRIRGEEAERILLAHVETRHPKARRAVVQALGNFRSGDVAKALVTRATSDASYLVSADAARALGKTKHPSGFATLVEVQRRASWADVIEAASIDGLAALRDERAVAPLEEATRYGRPTRVRRAAIMAVPKVRFDRRARELLESLLDDADPHLRIDVARALLELGDTGARGKLHQRLERDLDPRVRRRIREVLRDLGGDGKKSQSELKDELEKLRADIAKLTQKVTELEVRVRPSKLDKPEKAKVEKKKPEKAPKKLPKSAARKPKK